MTLFIEKIEEAKRIREIRTLVKDFGVLETLRILNNSCQELFNGYIVQIELRKKSIANFFIECDVSSTSNSFSNSSNSRRMEF